MEYKSMGKITKISGSSRASLKIMDSFYTFETSMEKCFDPEQYDKIDFDEEWKLLFEELNEKVDDQIEEVEQTYKQVR